MQRIVMLTLGSRGDVQPLVALGRGLQASGYRVRIATHENFRGFVGGWDLEFAPLAGDSQKLLEDPQVQRIFELGQGWKWLLEGARWLASQHERLVADCRAACRDADAVIYTPVTYPVWHCAQANRIPAFAVCYWPTTPTRAFAYPMFGVASLGGWLNLGSYRLFEQLVWHPLRARTNQLRQELGLRTLPAWGPYRLPEYRAMPWLYPFSGALAPAASDWPANQHVTGYWFLDAPRDWLPPTDLEAFMQAGPPPVAVGFGSMVPRASTALTQKVLEAIRLSGQRAVLLRGWGGLQSGRMPDGCFQIDAVPHDWLFPRVSGVVTHGGAGTVAAALRAGVPALAVPLLGDQFFWGRRLAELGAGPRPLPLKDLQATPLAVALKALAGDSSMRRRAAELGGAIRAEDGVARAVELVVNYLRRF
ncbi:glycosyltransferase [Gloeobacter violaceus]|nr:glycosyltransferase [Gloeobacter violaceus]